MDFSWFIFTLASMVSFGTGAALYKLPARKNQSKLAVVFWMMLSSCVFSVLLFSKYSNLGNSTIILISALWGIGYVTTTALQMYVLNRLHVSSLFPVTTTASLVITVLSGIFLFSETVSIIQTLGIILAAATIYSFMYEKGRPQYTGVLITLGLAIIFSSSFNKILYKLGTDAGDIHFFQIYQYLFGSLIALIGLMLFSRSKWKREVFSGSVVSGTLIGVTQFLGGYFQLIALTKGPFSLITALSSAYVFIAAIFAYFLFGETLTKRKIILIFLAIIAIALIRLG